MSSKSKTQAKKKPTKTATMKCPDCDGAGRWLGLDIWHDCKLCCATGAITCEADDSAVPEDVEDDTTDKMWIGSIIARAPIYEIDDVDITFDECDFMLLDFDPNSMTHDDCDGA